MNKKQMREIIQLIVAAKHSFYVSKKRFTKLSAVSKKTKMIDLANKFKNSKWSKDDNDLLILVSYLSSCGIRISTIYEVMNIKPKKEELYSKKLDHKHISHFLRDNVCHKEPGDEDSKYFNKRQKFLNDLTIEEIYEDVRDAIIECRNIIVEYSKNYRVLESIIENQFKNI